MAQRSNAEIYGLISDLRKEFNDNLGKLSDKVDDVKDDLADVKTKQAISSTKLGALMASISIVSSALMTAVFNKMKGL